jgi:L-2,4-diaminobutyrate decarboxylase
MMLSSEAVVKGEIRKLELAPKQGVGLDRALHEVAQLVIPNSTMVAHPRYVAHLHCPPTITSLAAETVLSAINQSMDSHDQGPAAAVIEQWVVDWLCDLFGYQSGDGVFTSGGTQSNLQALLLARDTYARDNLAWDVAEYGLPASSARWRIFCTRQTNFTVEQAARVLGLGAALIVRRYTDGEGRLNRDPCAAVDKCRSIRGASDRARVNRGNNRPGVVDPIVESSDHRPRRHLGSRGAAAGGCLVLSDKYSPCAAGISAAARSPSDYTSYCFIDRLRTLLLRRHSAFDILNQHVDYLNPATDDPNETVNLVTKSLQTTRRFDALKVFLTLRALGTETIAQMIDRTIETAHAAGRAAAADYRLRVIGKARTNTVLIRWTSPGLTAQALDRVNIMIREQLATDGHAVIGRTQVADGVALKLTFVNPVCTPETAQALIREIASRGELIAAAESTEVIADAETDLAS